MIFRAWCRFERGASNPLTGRMGRWRVTECYEVVMAKRVTTEGRTLGVLVGEWFRPGSFINPKKAMGL